VTTTAPVPAQPQPSSNIVATISIVALALLARGFVVWFVMDRLGAAWLFSRGIELGLLAQSIVTGNGLSSPFGGSSGPTVLLAPAYPALIAAIFWGFGSFTKTSAITIMAMQLGFNLLTVLLILWLAHRCFGSIAANIAGTIWALSLPLLWMPTIFWETSLSALLLVGMVGMALVYQGRPRSSLWIAMAGGSALAALVNPALLLPMLGILGWASWQSRRSHALLPGWLTLMVLFAPWPLRNALALHAFIPLRSTIGLELWMGNRPGANGYLDESVFPLFNRQELAQYTAQGEVAYMSHKTAAAWDYIEAHPLVFLRLSLVRLWRFWSGTGTAGGSAWFAFHALLTTAFGVIGIARTWKQGRRSLAVLFILPLLLFPLPYYVTHAEFRYRLVLDPLLTILTGGSIAAFGNRVRT
jgi:hypothetical protein